MLDGWLLALVLKSPRPSVAEPHLGYDMQVSGLGAAVVCNDSEDQLLLIVTFLGGLDEDIPVTVVCEGICVEDLIFTFQTRSLGILIDQLLVREFSLGVFVQELHVRVLDAGQMGSVQGIARRRIKSTTYRRGIIHMEMRLLDTLTMVALWIGQAEQAFF